MEQAMDFRPAVFLKLFRGDDGCPAFILFFVFFPVFIAGENTGMSKKVNIG